MNGHGIPFALSENRSVTYKQAIITDQAIITENFSGTDTGTDE
jgi:hypothetical protein